MDNYYLGGLINLVCLDSYYIYIYILVELKDIYSGPLLNFMRG